jgi:hypothetical protein
MEDRDLPDDNDGELAASFEILHRAFVGLSLLARAECAEITPFACLGILLARI